MDAKPYQGVIDKRFRYFRMRQFHFANVEYLKYKRGKKMSAVSKLKTIKKEKRFSTQFSLFFLNSKIHNNYGILRRTTRLH